MNRMVRAVVGMRAGLQTRGSHYDTPATSLHPGEHVGRCFFQATFHRARRSLPAGTGSCGFHAAHRVRRGCRCFEALGDIEGYSAPAML